MESNTTIPNKKLACASCGQEFAEDIDVCPFDGTKLTVISQELAPGTVLGGRFEIISSVAGGGMGTVYKARHTLMKRIVAIKTLQPFLVASGASLKRFQQEAQALSSLNHPHILSVYDFFVSDDGMPYLVMDYLEGTNLQELIKSEKQLSWQRALPIFIDACAGFASAHSHSVIHRDVKPSNLMLVQFEDNWDFVKIIDFGIAKLSNDQASTHGLTATGDVFGSPPYMSPEQCRARALDPRSDIYSFGCVMYETLTGVPPFLGADSMECMFKQVHEATPPFPSGCDSPTELQSIILKCLEKEPDQRWQSMNDLRAALKGFRQAADPSANDGGEETQQVNLSSGGNKSLPDPVVDHARIAATVASMQKVVEDATASSAATQPVTDNNSTASNQSLTVEPAIGQKRNSKNMIIAAVSGGLILAIGSVMALMPHQSAPHMVATGSSSSSIPASAGSVQTAPINSLTSTSSAGAGSHVPPTPATPKTDTGSITVSPRPQPAAPTTVNMTPQESYQTNLDAGRTSLNQGHYQTAWRYFDAAHRVAQSFGEQDDRYVDSLEWQAKAAMEMGNYQAAKQAMDYVIWQRKHHKHDAAKLAEAERVLKDINTKMRQQ